MAGGVVAAGHPLTAEAGAQVLRAGGNAVDAAVGACLMSWAAEPLLTGPGAGGYLLVAGDGAEPVLLDFFVAAPSPGEREPLTAVEVDFGDALQTFNCGAAAVGVPGLPSGLQQALHRWGTMPRDALAAPAARAAREGVALNRQQAFITDLLGPILTSTPGVAELHAPGGALLREGDVFRSAALAATIERFGADGAAPFYVGDLAAAAVEHVQAGGGTLTSADLAAYVATARAPQRVSYRGREVLTNPAPNAGGPLLSLSLAELEARPAPPAPADLVAAMQTAQAARTEDFYRRLIGSTTHISVMDSAGMAASLTCTNGEGSGIVVPGTGIHLNNIMGEEDLNPLGFFVAEPGTRMPSMMAPTVVLGDGGVEVCLGSAGSNRIRSAILQTIVGVIDHGRDAASAVAAPRLHFEAGTVYAEPGIDLAGVGHEHVRFREPNLFFGGVQAVERDPSTGALTGAGDPRRGGVAVAA